MTQDGTRRHGKAREDTTRHEKIRQSTRRHDKTEEARQGKRRHGREGTECFLLKCRRHIRGFILSNSFICASNQKPTRLTIEKFIFSLIC